MQEFLDTFSDNQLKYFNFLTGNQVEQNSNTNIDTPIINRTISIKYIVLGAALVLIIVAIILAIKYAITKTIKISF